MAQFEKGREKTGGRKKGVPNKATFSRARIQDLVDSQFENFVSVLGRLSREDPKAYAGHFVKLLSYVVPTLQSTTFEDKTQTRQSIDELLLELMGKR